VRTTTQTTDADALRRALAFVKATRVGAAQQLVEHPLGVQVLDDRTPRAYVMNALVTDAPLDPTVGAEALIAAVDALQQPLAHRTTFVADAEAGERLAPGMRERGWLVERVVFMVLRRERDRPSPAGVAQEVSEDELRAVEEAILREQATGFDEDVVQQLMAARRRLCAAVPVARFFLGADEGVGASTATLYSDGNVAQVEDVGTLLAHRDRGLARATVGAVIDAATAGGHGLVFVIADADDWPKELYAKLGFDPVGFAYDFTLVPRRDRPAFRKP
jgi:GNAT superfamily N-acetyltransferase